MRTADPGRAATPAWRRHPALFTVVALIAAACAVSIGAATAAVEKSKRAPKAPPPPVVTPGTPAAPNAPARAPSDAVVLFDGTDLSKFVARGRTVPKGTDGTPAWRIQDGYMEVVPN